MSRIKRRPKESQNKIVKSLRPGNALKIKIVSRHLVRECEATHWQLIGGLPRMLKKELKRLKPKRLNRRTNHTQGTYCIIISSTQKPRFETHSYLRTFGGTAASLHYPDYFSKSTIRCLQKHPLARSIKLNNMPFIHVIVHDSFETMSNCNDNHFV